jgi:hypothetical protein
VIDQMAGLKIASGDPIVHLGLFIATLLLPKDKEIDKNCKNLEKSILLLCISHGVNALRILVKLASE